MSGGGVGLTSPPRCLRHALSFRHVYILAIAAVLFSTGTVPFNDLLFFLFSLIYTYFLASIAFPLLSSSPNPPILSYTTLFRFYFNLSTVVGLLLPFVYIIYGMLLQDRDSIEAVAPHVFLLCCQAVMEGVFFGPGFSLPMRAFVPIFYHGRRLFTVMEWARYELNAKDGWSSSWSVVMRVYVGRGLAVANLVLWGYNLFGFLLPVYLPRALERYYEGKVKKGSD